MDLISAYIAYNRETEPPYIYHRWCAISAIAALLGRSTYIQLGHFRIFPNLYLMFIGEPAARKSTAIKIAKKLVSATGYNTFGADKTSKEKFLLDLEGALTDEELHFGKAGAGSKGTFSKILEVNLGFDGPEFQEPREVYVVADEFNEWAGTAQLEFYTTLGNLWDFDDDLKPFTQRFKNSRSVSIFQPTINILGGNTPENFARAFPPEIIGQGFLSRMLLIHGERSSRKYSDPPIPSDADRDFIIRQLSSIRSGISKRVIFTNEANEIRDSLYHTWNELEDSRFKSYNNRRYSQLLKICIICAAARNVSTITREILVEANTYLSAAEALMPRALGEFGKSKNSDIVNRITDHLQDARRPIHIQELWKLVYRDLDKVSQLSDIMANLAQAGKVQAAPKGMGFLPVKKVKKEPEFVDWSLLTEEERDML